MRTARTFGGLVPFVFLLFWGGGAVGCSCGHADCASIAPGTPVADIPVGPPQSFSGYCGPVPSGVASEGSAFWCCTFAGYYEWQDGGVRDCGTYGIVDCTKLAPAEFRRVGDPYSGWECARDEGFGAPKYGCYVWVRDGGVLGACGGCPPD